VARRVEARPVREHRTWRGAANASRGYERTYYEEQTMVWQVLSPAADARGPMDVIPPDEDPDAGGLRMACQEVRR
jgi:hypothetical protein